jgi:hypothetical protein
MRPQIFGLAVLAFVLGMGLAYVFIPADYYSNAERAIKVAREAQDISERAILAASESRVIAEKWRALAVEAIRQRDECRNSLAEPKLPDNKPL